MGSAHGAVEVNTEVQCYCVRGTRTQPRISVGCSLHYWVSCAINNRGVLRLHLCRHTFASLWGACLRFALLWRTSRVSSVFIFYMFAEVCYSVFVKHSSYKSLLNLRKAYIVQEFAGGLLSICVCWIFQSFHLSKVSAALVPRSKSTDLCSWRPFLKKFIRLVKINSRF